MISPASKGLFENAIVLSGSALNPSIPRVKDHLTLLYNLAENLHYPVDNNRDLLEFLKQVDAKLLTKRTFQNFSNPGFGRRMANSIWSTVIERTYLRGDFIKIIRFQSISTEKNAIEQDSTLFQIRMPLINSSIKHHLIF